MIDVKTKDLAKDAENTNSILEILLDSMCQSLITPEDKMLLDITFSKSSSQADLNDFFKKCDIEVMGGNKAIMLSYLMKMRPELEFSRYEQPRLSGLLKYFRFHNLKLIAHYTKLGKALNAANIPVMILKGGAMKYLRPELSRVMGDIDILVPFNDLYKTCKIAESIGYEFSKKNIHKAHSVDLHQNNNKEGCIDVHRYICMNTGFEERINKDLFARATKAKVFGVESLVPAFEDMLFLTLVNLAKNLRENTSSAGTLFTLFDCKFLIENKPDFNWNIVIENAKKTKTQPHILFAIKFLNKIVPGILPENLQEENLFKKEMYKYCKIVMFERFFYFDLQTKSRSIKILNSVGSFKAIKEYLIIKPKYYILKKIIKTPFLINMFFDFAV